MNKKYQIFISSTFEDLKTERQKIIDTILSLNQFPVGMEMFAADNDEQWVLIKETIDCSDLYVLVVGNKYGTVIQDGEYKGISYTEKEFRYALSQNIPVLAFVIKDDAGGYPGECDPEKAVKLLTFKKAVKTGRVVKFWSNTDELATQVSVSLAKAISRNKRPGWVRTTEFDIDKSMAEIVRLTNRVHALEALNADLKLENNRKPELKITYSQDRLDDGKAINDFIVENGVIKFKIQPVDVSDIDGELIYRDYAGREQRSSVEEVRCFRYLCKNGFHIWFDIVNSGNVRATGVKIKWKFPNNLLVLSMKEITDVVDESLQPLSDKAYENWNARFFEPDGANKTGDRYIPLDELISIEEIAELLDPADCDGDKDNGLDILPSEAEFRVKEIQHFDSEFFRGLYILPTEPGEYEIGCSILCNEYAEPVRQAIKVLIE